MTAMLGRLHVPDRRDAIYTAAPLVADAAPPSRPFTYWFNSYVPRNQGTTGTCVGHGWSHLVNGRADPYEVYRSAIAIDEFPENDNDIAMEFGTSVRAGAKAMQELGFLNGYSWAWDLDTATRWLWTSGPVVIGVEWHEGMFERDASGLLWPTGKVVGGHCVLLDGVNMETKKVRGMNSWDWGPFFMTFDVLEDLIGRDGEVCMPTEGGR